MDFPYRQGQGINASHTTVETRVDFGVAMYQKRADRFQKTFTEPPAGTLYRLCLEGSHRHSVLGVLESDPP